MRIIGGVYRGKKLKAPIEGITRPTSDRVKENLFNILTHNFSLAKTSVLDLFAGTGALGLEALSRGAKEATFVENHKETMDLIRENSKSLKDVCTYVLQDVDKFLQMPPVQPYDIIFMDPPYHWTGLQAVLKKIIVNQWIKTTGILILETSSDSDVSLPEILILRDKRTYGKTTVWFIGKDAIKKEAI